MAVVYKHTSPEGKVYIGICGSDNLRYVRKDRWQSRGQGYKYNLAFWEDIQKFGWDNFTHEILLTGIEEERELKKKEAELIRYYNSDNPQYGYNKKSAYRAVRCIETKNIYLSIAEASRETGISRQSIGQCCKGKTKSAGKLHWEYFEGC